jgi:hypothetical protein
MNERTANNIEDLQLQLGEVLDGLSALFVAINNQAEASPHVRGLCTVGMSQCDTAAHALQQDIAELGATPLV